MRPPRPSPSAQRYENTFQFDRPEVIGDDENGGTWNNQTAI